MIHQPELLLPRASYEFDLPMVRCRGPAPGTPKKVQVLERCGKCHNCLIRAGNPRSRVPCLESRDQQPARSDRTQPHHRRSEKLRKKRVLSAKGTRKIKIRDVPVDRRDLPDRSGPPDTGGGAGGFGSSLFWPSWSDMHLGRIVRSDCLHKTTSPKALKS